MKWKITYMMHGGLKAKHVFVHPGGEYNFVNIVQNEGGDFVHFSQVVKMEMVPEATAQNTVDFVCDANGQLQNG